VVSKRATAGHAHSDRDPVFGEREIVASLQQAGIDATWLEGHGEPGAAIVGAAADLGADLIAMSTHRRGPLGRIVHGSVAEKVLRASRIPILLATPTCTRRWAEGRALRILVPLDGSPLAEQALALMVDRSQGLDAELRLVRIVQQHLEVDALGFGHAVPVAPRDRDDARVYLEKLAAPLRQAGRNVLGYVADGDPADRIARLVGHDAIDLVVMATHGRGSLANLVLDGVATVASGGRMHLVLGSVAAAVVRRVSVPVLLVRPAELGTSERAI
jgi:nucleotide-binding universal stress UspA family protein